MRRPSAFEVRRTEMGSNQADSIRMLRVLKPISRFGAAHHAADGHGVRRVGDDAHVFCERALGAVERSHLFAGPRAAHDDALLPELIEIEGVHGLAQLEHDVVRDVHHVVDRLFADGFEALAQPVGRRLHLHALDHARGVAAANLALRYRRAWQTLRSLSDSFSAGCRGFSVCKWRRLRARCRDGPGSLDGSQ